MFDPDNRVTHRHHGFDVLVPVSAPTVLVGTEESYDARCRHCHEDVFQYGFPGARRTVVTG